MNTETCHPDAPTKGEFCRKLIDALAGLKHKLIARYEQILPGSGELIRRAVNEAELVAWETSFPHLVLPDLAEARLAALAPALAYAKV